MFRVTRIGNNMGAGAATMRKVLARFMYIIKTGVIAVMGSLAIITTVSAVQGHAPRTILLGLPIGFAVLLLVGSIFIFVRYGQSGWRVGNGTTNERIPGDGMPDSKWIWGIFYFNRDDPSLMVERRIGLGITFNFAHPASWLILGAIIAIPIGLTTLSVLTRHH